MSHTIVLAQFSSHAASRQYSDFDSLERAMDGLCQLYELKLKSVHPNRPKISYDISELYEFIDSFPDLCALTFDEKLGAYIPRNKEFIKKKIYEHLKKEAQTDEHKSNNNTNAINNAGKSNKTDKK